MPSPLTGFCKTLLCCTIGFFGLQTTALAAERLSVLTSTFPIHQITRNVANGRAAVTVSLMLPPTIGCPHDYTLTPQDMQRLSSADVLIINGLGMEAFLDSPLKKAPARLRIIDSSTGITALLHSAEMDAHPHAHGEADPKAESESDHVETNPHLFASPRMTALLAKNIAAELSKIDPQGAEIYAENSRAYAEKMNRLADEFAALGKQLTNTHIVTQHGVFDYLARDMGLEIVAVIQAHAGQEPSAAEMLALIKTIREKKAGAVFTEPQYPEKIGKTIAREAGIAAATLDSVATGPENAPLDHYEIRMRDNQTVMKETLGTR